MSHDEQDQLRRVFEAGAMDSCPTVNKRQMDALAALMARGNQAAGPESIGPTRGYADPPSALMLIASHQRIESPMPGEPAASEVTALAEDGRAWTIARAGIAWPIASNPVEPL